MPNVRSEAPVALALADIHLSDKAPLARRKEPDWFAAMDRSLKQLRELEKQYQVPVLCAGDVFDRWNSSAALINFAMDALPEMYVIPGQHDLPYHGYERLDRTPLYTLIKAGRLKLLPPRQEVFIGDNLKVVGFPWGSPLSLGSQKPCNRLAIAVIHMYCWIKDAKHPEAKMHSMADKVQGRLRNFDLAILGDNHKPFFWTSAFARVSMYNCGSFFRRSIDQGDHRPSVGLIYQDGSIKRHYIVDPDEVFEQRAEIDRGVGEMDRDVAIFLRDLQKLEAEELDFVGALRIAADEFKGHRSNIRTALLEIASSVSRR